MKVHRKKWTEEEIEFLQEYWGFKTLKEMSKRFGRTIRAIREHGNRLGLTTLYNSHYITLGQVATILKVYYKTVKFWSDSKGLKVISKTLCLRKVKLVTYENLIEWLKDNQDSWDSRKLEINGLTEEFEWLKKKRAIDSKLAKNISKVWTDYENEILNKMDLAGKKNSEIAKRLDRTLHAVRSRKNRLKKELTYTESRI